MISLRLFMLTSVALLVWISAMAQTYRPFNLIQPATGIRTIAISPDGTRLAAATVDSEVKIWNLQSGELKITFAADAKRSRRVNGLAYSPDGKLLAIGLSKGTVTLRDAGTGRDLRSWSASNQAVGVAFSPDGARLLTGDPTGIKLWSPDSGKLLFAFPEPVGEPTDIAFRPDGKRLAIASTDANIRIWNLESGQLERVVEELTLEPFSLSWSPDGKLLASAGADGAISLWNTATWKRERTLGPQLEPIDTIAFSPDGRSIASGSLHSDSFRSPADVKLWNIQSGQFQVLGIEEAGLNSVAFARAGQLLVTSTLRGNLRIWRRQR